MKDEQGFALGLCLSLIGLCLHLQINPTAVEPALGKVSLGHWGEAVGKSMHMLCVSVALSLWPTTLLVEGSVPFHTSTTYVS